jgi:hypothetical protein
MCTRLGLEVAAVAVAAASGGGGCVLRLNCVFFNEHMICELLLDLFFPSNYGLMGLGLNSAVKSKPSADFILLPSQE